MPTRTANPPEDLDPRSRRTGEVPPEDELEPLEPDTLVIENEVLRQGFTLIPNYVLRDPTVSPGAKTTFMLLLSYAWQEGSCFPGQARLARELGVAKRSIIRWLQELEEHNIIASKRRGLGKTNVYRIVDRDKSTTPGGGTPRSDKLSHPEVTETVVQEVPKTAHKENTVNKNPEQQQVVVANKKVDTKRDNTSGDEPPQTTQVIEALTGLGISTTVAKRLVSRYQDARILQKIDYLQFLQEYDPKKVKNPRGWLRYAIENDYGPPDGYKTPQERAAEAQRKENEERERQRVFETTEQSSRAATWTEDVVSTLKVGNDLQQLTYEVQATLESQLTPAQYNAWASRFMITHLDEDQVNIAVPSKTARDWLSSKLRPRLERALQQTIGKNRDVQFEVVEQPVRGLQA